MQDRWDRSNSLSWRWDWASLFCQQRKSVSFIKAFIDIFNYFWFSYRLIYWGLESYHNSIALYMQLILLNYSKKHDCWIFLLKVFFQETTSFRIFLLLPFPFSILSFEIKKVNRTWGLCQLNSFSSVQYESQASLSKPLSWLWLILLHED